MRNFILNIFIVSIALMVSSGLYAQNVFFTDAGQNRVVSTNGDRVTIPQKFRTSFADIQSLKNFLWTLPKEQSVLYSRGNTPVLELPMPDGSMAKFHVWESSIQEPGLQAKFPNIRTYAGQGIDDPYATVRFAYSPEKGFNCQVLSDVKGRVFIDPYAQGDVNNYISYYTSDFGNKTPFNCGVTEFAEPLPRPYAAPCRGTQLYTYRLAVACTNEYAAAVGGTTDAALHAAIVTAVNRVVGVYEKELSIRMVLVANNDLIEFTTVEPDPFTGNSNANTLINESQTQITNIIGTANFDIGHTFSTGAGGLAGLGVVCSAGNKARGVTGLTNPIGDAFYIDFVAHEMGHQFRGNHSFNGQTGNCSGGNRNAGTAYEVGSGTTIQAYAGICGTDDIQPNSDPYFHTISFDEISNFVTTGGGASCAVITPTGNNIPIITAMDNNGANIPLGTPFTLSGAANDPDGDAITYSWEQWDLGPQGAWNSGGTNATAPNFKFRVPKTTGSRTFPDMAVILANYPVNPPATLNGLKGETLPTVARAMKFRFTVRDNKAAGGAVVNGGDGCGTFAPIFQVNAIAATGPFVVTFPNGGETISGGSTQTITWDVAGTNVAPISTANVKISLSTDGGLTYPTVIAASTPNDGTEDLTMPFIQSTTARIKIEAVGNIYFDISNNNFTLTAPLEFSFNSPAAVVAACPAPASMQTTLTASFNVGYTSPVTLTTSGNPAGTTVVLGTNPLTTTTASTTVTLNGTNTLASGSYTVTVTGTGPMAATQTRNITFTISAGSGPVITTQPSNQTVCVGANASFIVAAASGTYQWQMSTNGGSTWANVSGATTATYSITGATVAMNNNQYRVVVTGQCGVTNSTAATLTVNTPPVINTQPTGLSLCASSAASFTVAATGSGLTYQWQVSNDAGVTYTPIAGATSATYLIAATTTGMNNNRYRVVVTGSCPPAVTSSAVVLNVSSDITITSSPTSVTICEATNTSFKVASSGSGLTYQWEVSINNGAFTAVTNGGVYSGATTPTLTLTNVPPTFNTNRYRAVVSNPPCNPGTSAIAILTVNTYPIIGTQPQNATLCAGANNTFSVAATTGVGTLSYQWQSSVDNGTTYTNIPGATNSSLALNGVTAGANGYRYRVIVTAGCGSVTSNGAILTVNAYPTISLGAIPAFLCKSDPVLTLTGTPTGSFSGTGVAAGNFNPTTAGVGTATVTYTATNAGCTSTATRAIVVGQCPERQITLDKNGATLVYPVPNNGNFNIRLNSDLYTRLGVKIYNSSGQMVKSMELTGLTYGSVRAIDLTNAPAGVYHLFLYNNENGISSKGVSIIKDR